MGACIKRDMRAMSARMVFSLTLAAVLAAGLLVAGPALAAGIGTYEVQVPAGGGAWTTVGSAAFGYAYSSQSVSLPGAFQQVRLVQHGGTAAQLDGLSLSGAAPMAVAGSSDGLVLSKLAAVDNDVTNVFDQAVVVTFPTAGSALRIDARIQGDISGAWPFEFPKANTYTKVGPGSSFYKVGALPASVDTASKPFLAEYCETGTGHPDGTTYIWLANDGDNLLATVDFTPDNTLDGAEDYAAVHVRTPGGVKEFKISAVDSTWGSVAFAYTDKVSYQHKVYAFRIPWADAGVSPGEAEVAFTAYGTASVMTPVYRYYNLQNGSHFYTISAAEKASIDANLSATYHYEGIAFAIDTSNPQNKDPLYRFYSPRIGSHFYTVSAAEKDSVIANLRSLYQFEGVAFEVCAPASLGSRNIYRFYNTQNGSHFYTASLAERDAVLNDPSGIYAYEGVGFHIF